MFGTRRWFKAFLFLCKKMLIWNNWRIHTVICIAKKYPMYSSIYYENTSQISFCLWLHYWCLVAHDSLPHDLQWSHFQRTPYTVVSGNWMLSMIHMLRMTAVARMILQHPQGLNWIALPENSRHLDLCLRISKDNILIIFLVCAILLTLKGIIITAIMA